MKIETAEIGIWRAESSSGTQESPALTPAQLQLRQTVLDSVTSTNSRRAYAKGLDLLFAFAASRPLTRALLMEYATAVFQNLDLQPRLTIASLI